MGVFVLLPHWKEEKEEDAALSRRIQSSGIIGFLSSVSNRTYVFAFVE